MSEPHQEPARQYKPDGAQGSFQGNYGVSSAPQEDTPDSAYGYRSPSYSQYTGYGTTNLQKGSAPEKPSLPGSAMASVFIASVVMVLQAITLFIIYIFDDLWNLIGGSGSSSYGAGNLDALYNSFAIFSFLTSLAVLGAETFCIVRTYRGANWARIALTVILGYKILVLPSLLQKVVVIGWMAEDYITLIISVLSGITLVCLWCKSSSEYYEKMKLYKQWEEDNKAS